MKVISSKYKLIYGNDYPNIQRNQIFTLMLHGKEISSVAGLVALVICEQVMFH